MNDNKLVLWIMPLAVALLVWSLPRVFGFLNSGETWLADWRYATFSAREPQNSDIVILAITEKTLGQLPYRAPLDRGFLADLIVRLDALGVRAIGLDLFFDQPTEAGKDRRFFKALANAKAPVTVAWVNKDHEARRMTEGQRAFFGAFSRHTGVNIGLVNLPKPGGVVRRMNPESDGIAGFPIAIATSLGIDAKLDDYTIVYRAPSPEGHKAFAKYGLLPKQVSVFPPAKWLQNKIVLIGAIRPYEDRHRTPLYTAGGTQGGSLPGVVIHAHALAQILDGRSAPGAGAGLVLPLIVVMALAGLWLATRERGLPVKITLGVMVIVGFIAASHLLFKYGGTLTPLLAPIAGFLLSLALATAWLGRRHRRQQRFLKQAFSKYVSKDVVEKLQQDPSRLRLGGEKREVTLLFTDVQGFTTLSEGLEPEQLAQLLNEYFDGMVRIVFRHRGTLDKFIGDAIVVIFGAPGEQADHAQQAVDCALAMDDFAQTFAAEQQARNIGFGATRIGVHTGVVAIGNFGGSEQFNYTAMGDHVNTAARLEGVNKYFGTRVCVSQSTVSKSNGHVYRPMADLVVKGKTEPVPAYEPVSAGHAAAAQVDDYNAAYAKLVNGHFDAALEAFRSLHATLPHDGLIELHTRRLEAGEKSHRIVMEAK